MVEIPMEGVLLLLSGIAIVHFDAHTDLREEYLGEALSHSAVIRHSANIVGFENLKQIGIRSGMKEEFQLMEKYGTLIKEHKELDSFKDNLEILLSYSFSLSVI